MRLTKSSGSSDKKGPAGGSFGIGKFAPFACSDLFTVFYNTYDIEDECAYQGVSRLVTFERVLIFCKKIGASEIMLAPT